MNTYITLEAALEMRVAYSKGARVIDLEARYNIGCGTVCRIIGGQHWTVKGRMNLSRGRGRPLKQSV